jgi:hypothetical protein
MQIQLGGNNPQDNEFSIPTTDFVVGDQAIRRVTLTPTGTVAPTEIDVATDATTSSLLDTDTTNGLFTAIFTCSVPFDFVMNGPYPVLTGCQGDLENPIPSQPVIFGPTNLTSVALTPGTPTYLAVVMGLAGGLPNGGDDVFKSLTSVIRYTFTAVQPSGGPK